MIIFVVIVPHPSRTYPRSSIRGSGKLCRKKLKRGGTSCRTARAARTRNATFGKEIHGAISDVVMVGWPAYRYNRGLRRFLHFKEVEREGEMKLRASPGIGWEPISGSDPEHAVVGGRGVRFHAPDKRTDRRTGEAKFESVGVGGNYPGVAPATAVNLL